MEAAVQAAQAAKPQAHPSVFGGTVEHAIAHIEESIEGKVPAAHLRWYAVKLFERDDKVQAQLQLPASLMAHIEEHIQECERELEDDSESIITNERYAYISKLMTVCIRKKPRKDNLSVSDKIDRVVTNRILALPIFVAVMTLVYYVSVTTIGDIVTNFTNDTLFGAGSRNPGRLAGGHRHRRLAQRPGGGRHRGGRGGRAGFRAPDAHPVYLPGHPGGYRLYGPGGLHHGPDLRKFGLSGKSFIPMLIGSGCGVPGIMASRTIENERDRRMTIITTTFIPCGAKMPIVGLIAGAVFGGAWWVSPAAYFIGVGAVILSGIILKKTKMFAGDPAPFVMELPAYHAPLVRNVLKSMWERGWSFIKRAGTVILASSILIWFLSSFGSVDGAFTMVEDMDHSILAAMGNTVAWIFTPLGFGNWQSTVATIMGLVAKEEVVAVFGVLYGVAGDAMELVEAGAFQELGPIAAHFTGLSAFSFLIFNLLCAPCFAAIGAIKREMNSPKWTWFAIGYQCGLAYTVA